MSVGGAYATAFAAHHRHRTRALGIVATLPLSGTAEESVEEAMEKARPEFEALADHHGFLRDAGLLHQAWEVDLAAVACPTHLWYGEHDERALPGAVWFADHIAQASLSVRPHSTHLATLADHWPDTLVTLTDRPSPC